MWHILALLDIIITPITPNLVGLFYIIDLIHHTIFTWYSIEIFIYLFTIEVFIAICVSCPATLVSCTVIINIDRNILYVAFKKSSTNLTCPGAPTPQSIIISYSCAVIYSKYITVAHLYFSAQLFIFSHMVLISENKLSIFQ